MENILNLVTSNSMFLIINYKRELLYLSEYLKKIGYVYDSNRILTLLKITDLNDLISKFNTQKKIMISTEIVIKSLYKIPVLVQVVKTEYENQNVILIFFYDNTKNQMKISKLSKNLENKIKLNEELKIENYQKTKKCEKYKKEILMLKDLEKKILSSISHEFKTPINGILGFSNLLVDNFKNINDDKKLNFLNEIKTNSNRLLSMITDLINIYKISEDNEVENYEKINLFNLITEVSKSYYEKLKEHKNKIVINIPQGLLVFYNSKYLKMILKNILSNAIKYSYPETDIEFFSYIETINNRVLISIKNYGLGIEKKHYTDIFNLFYRIKNIDEASGSGVGLSLVKKILEKTHSKIWVESEFKKWITFNFKLELWKN